MSGAGEGEGPSAAPLRLLPARRGRGEPGWGLPAGLLYWGYREGRWFRGWPRGGRRSVGGWGWSAVRCRLRPRGGGGARGAAAPGGLRAGCGRAGALPARGPLPGEGCATKLLRRMTQPVLSAGLSVRQRRVGRCAAAVSSVYLSLFSRKHVPSSPVVFSLLLVSVLSGGSVGLSCCSSSVPLEL